MLVTQIAPIDHKKKRVCIDESYTFPLYLSEIHQFHIEVGKEISYTTMAELRDLLFRRLRERILYYITDCDKSELEIRRKMNLSGYPEDILSDVIQSLKEYHYIDDERYAVNYAHFLSERHHKSRNYIKNKLFEKGISRDIIETAMETIPSEETELILKEIHKKGYSEDSFSELNEKTYQKLYAMLLRKGFHTSDINRVITKRLFYD